MTNKKEDSRSPSRKPRESGVSGSKPIAEQASGVTATQSLGWPDPTPAMLNMPEFNAVWQCIKGWDINVPGVYDGYMGATGNHVRAILDALTENLRAALSAPDPCEQLRQERDESQARMKWIAEWYDENDPRCAGVRAAMRVGAVELVCTEIDAARKPPRW